MTTSYKILTSTSQKSSLYRFNSNLLTSNLLKVKSNLQGGAKNEKGSKRLEENQDLDLSSYSAGFLPDSEFVVNRNDQDFILWKVNGQVSEVDLDAINTDITLIKLPFSKPDAAKITCVAAGKKSSRFIYVACTSSTEKIPSIATVEKRSSFILIWDRKDEKYLSNIIPVSGPVHKMVLTTDDQKLAAALSNSIAIHSTKHNTTTYLENPFDGNISCIDFYPFKKSVLVAGGKDGSIAVWDINVSPKPSVIKKRIHASAVTAVCFAPCNKHFYCSVGLDRMVHFHDINSPASSKGLLQSYQSEFPLLSLSINDDHTVAMGDAKGHVLIYDLRQKQLIHTIEAESRDPIYSLSFQPPKWAITSALKDHITYDLSRRVITPKPDIIFDKVVGITDRAQEKNDAEIPVDSEVRKPAVSGAKLSAESTAPKSSIGTVSSSSNSVMDIFSPVNKGRILQPKTSGTSDLRRAATLGLFNEKLKNVTTSMSLDHLGTPSASIQSLDPPSSLRIARSADNLEPLSAPPSASSKASELNETIASLKKDLDDGVSALLDNAVATPSAEEQTPTQKQMLQNYHNQKPQADSQKIKPPHAPTPSSLKTPSVAAGGMLPESSKDYIATEVAKKVGGLIGGQNSTPSMTPSAFLKSAYRGTASSSAPLTGSEATFTSDAAAASEQVSNFQYKVIRGIVEEVVQDYHDQLRRDVQNVHVEILKQFNQQKIEFEQMLQQHLPTRDMVDLLESLQLENDRLRRNF